MSARVVQGVSKRRGPRVGVPGSGRISGVDHANSHSLTGRDADKAVIPAGRAARGLNARDTAAFCKMTPTRRTTAATAMIYALAE